MTQVARFSFVRTLRASRMKTALAVGITSLLVVGSVVPSHAFSRSSVPALTGGKPAMVQSQASAYRADRNFDAPRHHTGQSYRGGNRWRNGGAAFGAGVGGLAAGALIGEAMASSTEPVEEAVSYCANRFKSYDPSTGTYLGYDGDEHPCP